jgi:hypothetical protein
MPPAPPNPEGHRDRVSATLPVKGKNSPTDGGWLAAAGKVFGNTRIPDSPPSPIAHQRVAWGPPAAMSVAAEPAQARPQARNEIRRPTIEFRSPLPPEKSAMTGLEDWVGCSCAM